MSASTDKPTGQVLLFTGDGKGKTTAALGLAVRMAGHDMRVLVVQFAKGTFPTGEEEAMRELGQAVTFVTLGEGWLHLGEGPPCTQDVEYARRAWEKFLRLASGDYDAIILDEINVLLAHKLLPVEEVTRFVDDRPVGLTLVLTGRGRIGELVERADYVTEMKKLKHPFDHGQSALPGIDY